MGLPGVKQSHDFTQYQSAPCYFGVPKGEEPLDIAQIKTAFGGVRELYGLAPWFEQVPTVAGQLTDLYGANTPLSDIQANCPRRPALPQGSAAGAQHPRSVQVLDRAIWPDAAGNCPAGRDSCLTSIKGRRFRDRSAALAGGGA